ncbi:MAG: hypothetical protein JWN02_599, partial [Acidobacteria bacterium]|nr:hypothetical protein [Acidobacteriota bacterium]
MIRGFSRARLAVLGFLAAMLLPAVGQAQLAYDTSTTAAATVSAGAPTVTFTHTSTASENRLMIVGISANITANTGLTVSAVSYDNVPLTLDAAGNSGGGPLVRLETWSSRAVQPSSGAHTVSVTFTGFTGAATAKVVIGASTFIDADYAASTLATATTAGNNATPTQAVASAAGRLVVDFVAARSANPTPSITIGAGQTLDYSANSGAATTNDILGFSSREAGAASVTMSWTLGSSQRWVNDGYSLVRATTDVGVTQTVDPVAAGGTTTFTFVITDHTQTGSNGVTFADTLPAGFTATSVATTRGTCTIGGGGTTISCTIGTLASDATGTVTVIATAPAAGTYSNTGTITTGTVDTNAANNSSTVSVVVGSSIPNPTCNPATANGGAGGTLNGIVNTYFPGSASIAVAATSVTVGASSGAATPISIGDLLMIVQMQDAGIDSNNDERYGDGTGTAAGTTGVGSGSNALNSAGRYEYVVATNNVAITGGTINFTGAGTATGTVFAYNNAAATGTQGQRRFQVIRVPQYSTATLSSGLTALPWTGAVGGVLSIDVAGVLTLGGTVSVSGMGFRGGAGRQVAGGTGAATDYRNTSGNANGGTKGEGIAGTPQYLYNPATGAIDAGAAQGYPNGDADRGAPGNAGGGGTDGHPSANDENSGGGGGGNGGAGGIGGNSWQSNLRSGGFGGAAFQVALARLALGGGGGGGSRNNDDLNDNASSGAKGGGMVI